MKIEKSLATMPSFTKVAAHAGVSSGKDEMLHSLAAQVIYSSNYIQQHPRWLYTGVYADEALTGTKDNRPEFSKRHALSGFIKSIENSNKVLNEFDERLWIAAIDKVAVTPDGKLVLIFKDGTEVCR